MCLVLTCTTRTDAGLQSEDAELTTPMGPPLAHLARYGGEVSPQGVGSGLRRVALYGGGMGSAGVRAILYPSVY